MQNFIGLISFAFNTNFYTSGDKFQEKMHEILDFAPECMKQ